MYLQTGHESEWLRRLRQEERRIRHETNADHCAAVLTTEITETQSVPGSHRARQTSAHGWTPRLTSLATMLLRWSHKATSGP